MCSKIPDVLYRLPNESEEEFNERKGFLED